MARNTAAQQQRILKRNELVRDRYHSLREMRDAKNGARKYTEEWIFKTLESEYHLSFHALQDIISHQYEKSLERKKNENTNPNQTSLFT